MPKLQENQVPSYRLHKQSGQAIVTLSGKDHLLGTHGTKASRAKYDQLIGEWLANGRRADYRNVDGLTVARILAEFVAYARAYYRNADGRATGEFDNFRIAINPLKELYASTIAADFGPRALKALQGAMIKRGWCRTYVNRQIGRIKQVFRWAASQELIPATVYQSLETLPGLRKGKAEVRESAPVRPVAEAWIDAAIPHVSRQVGRCLSDELAAACYVGTVNRDGEFRLWQMSARGRKLVCQAELSLDDVFKSTPDKPATSLVQRGSDRELPLILSIEPFPLWLPYVLEPRLARATEKSGLIGVSSDGRLLQWSSAISGALQLTDTVPTGRLIDILIDSDQNIVHVCALDHRKNRMTIVHAALDTKRCTRDKFPCNNPLKACFDRGTILLIYRKEVHAISPGGIYRCSPLKFSAPTRWHSGRYFTDGPSVFAVSFDGSNLQLERIGINNRLAWFERAGHDGPWSLSPDGSVFDGAGQRVAPTKSASLPNMRFLGVSPDGSRIAVTAIRDRRATFILNLNGAPTWREIQGSAYQELVGPQIEWSLSSGVNLRTHFSAIAVDKGGDLALITINWSRAFMLNQDGALILADLGQAKDPGRQKVAFQPATPPPGCRYDLKCATWKDGSRAYLDSRGMLHLKSSDPRMPELTLILSNQPVSGWTSVGATFGWRYFVGDAPTTTAAHVYELIRQFVSRLR